MTVTLAAPVPTISRIRLSSVEEPDKTVSCGSLPLLPSIVNDLPADVVLSISSSPSAVSVSVIEVVKSIVFELELFVSAKRMALRNSVSVLTLKVVSKVRASKLSRTARTDNGRRELRERRDRLRENMSAHFGERTSRHSKIAGEPIVANGLAAPRTALAKTTRVSARNSP